MPDENVQITARFVSRKYSINLAESTRGAVKSSHTEAAAGEKVTLSATPSEGYKFEIWSIATPEKTVTLKENPATLTMPRGEIDVVALFVAEDAPPLPPNKYRLTVESNDPEGGTATADKTETEAGEQITLTATPENGYQFTRWQVVAGDIRLINPWLNLATIAMPAENAHIEAWFSRLPPEVHLLSPADGAAVDTWRPTLTWERSLWPNYEYGPVLSADGGATWTRYQLQYEASSATPPEDLIAQTTYLLKVEMGTGFYATMPPAKPAHSPLLFYHRPRSKRLPMEPYWG